MSTITVILKRFHDKFKACTYEKILVKKYDKILTLRAKSDSLK